MYPDEVVTCATSGAATCGRETRSSIQLSSGSASEPSGRISARQKRIVHRPMPTTSAGSPSKRSIARRQARTIESHTSSSGWTLRPGAGVA